ncbi:MAG TPA: 4-(cytidine 5'-diphospho)-2-C-methyl-D-erythritol kinase [Thermoguttaceae bacterium]
MRIHHNPVETIIQAPAKLNLFFEVIGKRNDGYHEIETLMCPISLFDTLRFSRNQSGNIEFNYYKSFGLHTLNCVQSQDIPEDFTNLAVRAVELLRQHTGIRAGAKLRLIKRIPSAAGLGGGSSDAAAAIMAANIGWGLNWPINKLARLAATLGSDVPFFLVGAPAICRGRGEQVEQVDALGMLHFVVVRPPAGLKTEAVYRVCRPAESPLSVMPLIHVIKQGNRNKTGRMLFNRLQSAAATLSPWIDRLRGEFDQLDCLGHAMSGSGTSYFGLCRNARHARRIAQRLQLLKLGSVSAVHTCR